MAAAGSAVGLGNIWRFPYVAGSNGGSAFILIYLGVVICFGMSLALAELVVGRHTQRNPVGAFRALGGKPWSLVGYMGVATGFVILSFYIVVAGWTLAYFGFTLSGALDSTDSTVLTERFNSFVSSDLSPLGCAALFAVGTAAIVLGGIGHGIERANKVLMPLLFVLLIILMLRSVTLPGAEQGVAFILKPDFSKVTAQTFIDAISQAFFSLSIGMGTLLTYGSYLSKKENLPSSALIIVLIDTAVGTLALFMVLPAVFSAGLNPSAGPGLTFITLPAVFAQMPGGHLFGAAFFALLAIAALTSAVSILEPTIAYFVDEHKMSRNVTVVMASLVCFLLSVPASLSFGRMSGVTIFGKNWFDLMDFLSNSILLPLGGLLTALFVGWKWAQPAVRELNNEGALHLPWTGLWLIVLKFLAPIGVVAIVISTFM